MRRSGRGLCLGLKTAFHSEIHRETIKKAQVHAAKWLWAYTNDRPNMRVGGITPAQKLKMAA